MSIIKKSFYYKIIGHMYICFPLKKYIEKILKNRGLALFSS
jgi:hypothetical protein